jgi:K+-sensing histidine kinase KdpD
VGEGLILAAGLAAGAAAGIGMLVSVVVVVLLAVVLDVVVVVVLFTLAVLLHAVWANTRHAAKINILSAWIMLIGFFPLFFFNFLIVIPLESVCPPYKNFFRAVICLLNNSMADNQQHRYEEVKEQSKVH